jgi:transcriptional regulator with XRE-family HTH domain
MPGCGALDPLPRTGRPGARSVAAGTRQNQRPRDIIRHIVAGMSAPLEDAEPPDQQGSAVAGFGVVLRRLRVAARLTQEQLAARAGLSTRAISDIERGRVRSPRPESVRLLGGALGLTGPDLDRFHILARAEYWARRNDGQGRPDDSSSSGLVLAAGPGVRPGFGTGPALGPGERRDLLALPRDVPAFTGRGAELAELDARFDTATQSRASAVVAAGTADGGKTPLAMRWAHRASRGSIPCSMPNGILEGVSVTSIKIQADVRDRLARVAADDFPGTTLSEAVDRLLAEHEHARLRRHISAAYARLRADPEQWDGYTAELDEWDAVSADGEGRGR